jgi:hypothetical protein
MISDTRTIINGGTDFLKGMNDRIGDNRTLWSDHSSRGGKLGYNLEHIAYPAHYEIAVDFEVIETGPR